jgi:pseudaminic acid biosynthesis-associated methylase
VALNQQESLWAGAFGNEYIERNGRDISRNVSMLARALERVPSLRSCIEFGPSVGLVLRAVKTLYPDIEQHAVEINAAAVEELARTIPRENITVGSFLGYRPNRTFDLVIIKNTLICVAPDDLPAVYNALHAATGRYLFVCEYYNPTPVEIPYRGQPGMLFKRDFAGEIMDAFPDLNLVNYGFNYRRDPVFPGDDSTWFLMERA